MLFYSPVITNRLIYITHFIGREVLGNAFELTSDYEKFSSATYPKINYSNSKISETELWIQPHAILFEVGISQPEIECFIYNEQPAFFKTGGDYTFDLYAAAFYLLSRYEEYLPYEADEYGRFPYKNSIAFRNGFLTIPLINLWLNDFKKFLSEQFPDLQLAPSSFHYLPTYDIDEAYSYKHKGALRNAGATAKAIFKGRFKALGKRMKVLLGKETDPFDSYEWMDNLHKQYGLNPQYFFLVPQKLSKYDRNISPGKEAFKKLVRHHAEHYSIGVHPSWQSNSSPRLIAKEIETISAITHKPVLASRQHFIKFSLPETYRQLIDAGIKEEFSMGYGSINGFRGSVALPFYWFDLEKNEQTSLLIYPFCFMDANSFFEQKLNPNEALNELKYYLQTIKASGGYLIVIWHNTFLGTEELFTGWRQTYHDFTRHISETLT